MCCSSDTAIVVVVAASACTAENSASTYVLENKSCPEIPAVPVSSATAFIAGAELLQDAVLSRDSEPSEVRYLTKSESSKRRRPDASDPESGLNR